MTSTYVITGASRGLGLEFVKQISAKGHTVFALARNPDASEGLQKLVDNKKVFAFKLDALNKSSIEAAVKEVSKVSSEGIDYLINNAGICGERQYNATNTPGEEYIDVFNMNVVGVSNITQAFLPLIRKRGQEKSKTILNISSIIGSVALSGENNPAGICTAYSVSKAALNMLTKNLADNLANENIIVYAAHPGWVKTDMGGETAPVEVKDSIAGMLRVLESITPEEKGLLIDFEGKQLPW